MVLSCIDEDGKRVTPTRSTGLPVKGNKRKAEAMLNDWRMQEGIDLEKRIQDHKLRHPAHLKDILFTQFISTISNIYTHLNYSSKVASANAILALLDTTEAVQGAS